MWLAKVFVTLKPLVNDPQGITIQGGLHNLGFGTVSSVRAGKYFEIKLEASDKEQAERLVTDMCAQLLANPVIEDFRFEVAPLA
jgi:phosphoribosylformylglycinamidine synthase subunit PurS